MKWFLLGIYISWALAASAANFSSTDSPNNTSKREPEFHNESLNMNFENLKHVYGGKRVLAPTRTVSYNLLTYASLDNIDPRSTTIGCQDYYLELPAGWSIADNNPDSIAVTAAYNWGTHLMVLSDGSQFYTSNVDFPGQAGQARTWYCCSDGATALGQSLSAGVTMFKVNSCERRILIRSGSTPGISCSVGSFQQGSTCVNCAAGTFAPSSGLTRCWTCSGGAYTSASGASTCILCPSGSYIGSDSCALPGARVHLKCSIVSPRYGWGSLSGCYEYGTITSVTFEYIMVDFPSHPGWYAGLDELECSGSSGSGSSCISCLAGTFTSSSGLSSCTSCSAGLYTPDIGSTFCLTCPAGTYTSTNGAVYCIGCPSGTFTSTSGLSFCSSCMVGFYMSGSGYSVCQYCSAGKYVYGGYSCTDCIAGMFSSGSGLSTCSSCAVGTFGSSSGLSDCGSCLPGTYSPVPGSSMCQLCVAGTASTAAGAMDSRTCTDCAAGNFASSAGNSICWACEIGKYSNYKASTQCSTCASANYASTQGSTACTDDKTELTTTLNCEVGYFNDGKTCTGLIAVAAPLGAAVLGSLAFAFFMYCRQNPSNNAVAMRTLPSAPVAPPPPYAWQPPEMPPAVALANPVVTAPPLYPPAVYLSSRGGTAPLAV